MLEVFYRYCPETTINGAERPLWFSKRLCLSSFWNSCCYYENKVKGQFKFGIYIDRVDGLSEAEKEVFAGLEKKGAIIVRLEENSNTGSYRNVFGRALGLHDDLWVLFVEDDYLWRKVAVLEMMKTVDSLTFDYLTPYDHPVRYDDDYYGGVDIPHWERRVCCSGSWHYRSQESTCMTYMAKVSVLKEDANLHYYYSPLEKKCPNDRELFRRLQGLGGYSQNVDRNKRRLLLGPIPSLATHVHIPFLSLAVDWESEVIRIKEGLL